MNIHPNYNYPLHDIAILELNQPVTISTFANTICLSDGEEPEDGTICYASGYGATSNAVKEFIVAFSMRYMDDRELMSECFSLVLLDYLAFKM